MCRTHNVFTAAIEKFVGRPVQLETGVGADVAVQINFAALADGEDTGVFIERKTLATAVGNIVYGTEGLLGQLTGPDAGLRYAAQAADAT